MIWLDDVTLQYGDFQMCNLQLEVDAGEYAVLTGPTGSGKTSILEAICGLKRIVDGRICVGGQDVTRLLSAERRIGYVPQDLVLFPGLRVDEQIGFSLNVRKVAKPQVRQRVTELAELMDIGSLLMRLPKELSGGEKQRVAIARALAFRPKVLCLDEPLAAIDAATRDRLIRLLQNIHQRETTTVLHVTHDEELAASLGTKRFKIHNHELVIDDTAECEDAPSLGGL